MTITKLNPDALIGTTFDFTNDIYPYMGLNEGGNTVMDDPGNVAWLTRGVFGMGYYLYGDNLNTTFLSSWDTGSPPGSDAAKVAAKDAIQVRWANRLVPWFCATPASDNTCTNAAIRITDLQCYILDSTTGIWSRAVIDGLNAITTIQYDTTRVTSYSYSPRIMRGNIHVPAFPLCPAPADWATASPTKSKYRFLHAPISGRVTLANPENLGGILCLFDSQLISSDGLAFNATPKIMVQCGVDAGWDDDSVGSGVLEGAPYSPACCDSRWVSANADGTRRTHYVGTFVHPDSYEDRTSAYAVAGGKCVSTAAEFAANMPTRVYQTQV